jgi:hypothetical protein
MILNSQDILIWNPDNVYELDLAERMHVKLFEHAEIINHPDFHAVKNDPRKKIVIRDWWSWEGGDNQPLQDLSWADMLIIYTSEQINGPWHKFYNHTIKQFNNDRLICIVNGLNKIDNYPSDLVFDKLGHFFSKIVDVCQYQEWNIHKEKSKLFDALLGSAKTHRVFVYNKIVESGLLNHAFINLQGHTNYTSPDLHTYDDPKINTQNRFYNQDLISGLANGISVSHSIPFGIYQNSWYSIVAETMDCFSNFLTEKTAKPLFEKKIFVMFGSQGLLRRLHSMGYQTFHGIIDESYDEQVDPMIRWSMAFDQVIKLSTMDHVNVYHKARDILDHNHHHICNHLHRLEPLKEFLQMHLKNLDN